MKKLKGKVALVAGATRGSGRGIACMLGEAGGCAMRRYGTGVDELQAAMLFINFGMRIM